MTTKMTPDQQQKLTNELLSYAIARSAEDNLPESPQDLVDLFVLKGYNRADVEACMDTLASVSAQILERIESMG